MFNLLKKISLQILFCTLVTVNVFSQTPVTLAFPNSIGSCTDNHFSATVNSPTTRFKILATVEDTNRNCSTQRVLIVVDSVIGNHSNAFTDTLNNYWSVTLGNGNVTVYYRVLLDCGIGIVSGTSNTYYLRQTFLDTVPSSPVQFQVVNETTNYKRLPFQVVLLSTINTNNNLFSVSYLTPRYLTFLYKNSSTLPARVRFQFEPEQNNFCGKIHTTGLQFQDTAGTSFTTFSPNTYANAVVKSGDTLIVRQEVVLDSCIGTTVCPQKSKLYFRCSNPVTDNIFCSECEQGTFLEMNYSLIQSTPDKLKIERVAPSTSPSDYSCPNVTAQSVNWHYRLTNSGSETIDTVAYVFRQINATDSALNFLSLISKSTVSFQTHCTQCQIDTSYNLKALWLCHNSMNDALLNARVGIQNFGVNDTIDFFFTTLKCSEENDSILDLQKYYSRWAFDSLLIKTKTICNNDVSLDVNTTPTNATFWGSKYYISNLDNQLGNQDVYDVLLKRDFTPTVTDLSVPSGQTFGDSTTMRIDLKGITNSTSFDWNLFGCNNTPTNCTLRGYLKVAVKYEQGLRMKNPSSDAFLKLINPTTGAFVTANPIHWYTTVDTNQCQPGEYFFYYNLSDSAMYDFLLKGTFEFQMQVCCANNPSITPYQVRFYLLANPSNNCFTISIPASHAQPLTFSPNINQWLPTGSVSDGIISHCPGCRAPGAIIDKYKMKRISYGLQDSNNDSRADNGLPLITNPSAWYNTYKSLLHENVASYGERIADVTTAHFQDGDVNGGGYTYAQMTNVGAVLPVLQIMRNIPNGLDTMKLTVDSIYFYIDSANTSSPNCLDCDQFEGDPARWRTQRALKIGGSNLNTFLSTDAANNVYLFTFTAYNNGGTLTGNLHNNTSLQFYNDASAPFRTFFTGQQYRIKIIYRACGNWLPDPNRVDLENYLITSEIFSRMAFCGKEQTVYSINGIPPMLNDTLAFDSLQIALDSSQVPPRHFMDTAYTNNHLFFCETFGGRFYYYAQQYENNSFISDVSACKKRIEINVSANTGGYNKAVSNIYPYEFKPSFYGAEDYRVTIPSGYTITSARTRNWLIASKDTVSLPAEYSTNWQTFTPPSPNANGLIVFNDSNLPILNCLTENKNFPRPSTDSLGYLGDQYTKRIIELFIQKQTCDSFLLASDTSVKVVFNGINIPCLAAPVSCATSEDTLIMVDNQFLSNIPHLIPNYGTLDLLVTQRRVCDSIIISNPQTNYYYPSNQLRKTVGADNVFISVPTTAAAPYLANWTFTPSGSTTAIPAVGNVIGINNFLPINTTLTGKLCASSILCRDSIADVDTFSVYIGWNCDSFPTTPFNQNNVCQFFEQDITIHDASFLLTNSVNIPTYYLCDQFVYNACYNSEQQGSFYPFELSLSSIPPGLQIDSVTVYSVVNNIVSPPINGLVQTNSTNWTVPQAVLDSLHLGNGMSFSQLCVNFYVVPTCDFNPASHLPNISLTGVTFCGDTTTNVALGSSQQSLLSYGGSHCTNCFTVTKTVDTTQAAAYSDLVNYTIEICNNSIAALPVNINDNLPPYFTLVSGFIPTSDTIPLNTCNTYYLTGYFTKDTTCNANYNRVTVTANNPTTIKKDSVCITTFLPCANAGTKIWQGNLTTASLQTRFDFTSFYLKDTLYVTDTLELYNCTVIVASGGKIYVQHGGILNLNNTNINGCQYMWRGVRAKGGSKVSLDELSSIQDADTALKAEHLSNIFSRASFFRNNIHNIVVPPKYSAGLNNVILNITSTHFEMIAQNFKLDFVGQDTSHRSIPVGGIELYDWSGTIGNNLIPNDENFFHNMIYGVIGTRCPLLRILNNRFTSIHVDFGKPWQLMPIWSGFAVVSYGRTASPAVQGDLLVTPSLNSTYTIAQSSGGVYSYYSNLNLSNVNISAGTPVRVTICKDNLSTLVSGCTLVSTGTGIVLSGVSGSAFTRILNNTITVTNTNGVGINCYESSVTGDPNILIEGNTINLNGSYAGITLTSVFDAEIYHNTINHYPFQGIVPAGRSIGLQGCNETKINCNILQLLTNNQGTNTVGIISSQTSNNHIFCDSIFNHITGININSGGAGSEIVGNSLHANSLGIRIGNSAAVGLQAHKGNKWIGFSSSVWADGGNNFNLSEFRVDTNSNPGSTFNPLIFAVQTGWFNKVSGQNYSCATSQSCADTSQNQNQNRSLEMAIATQDSISPEFVPETKAVADAYLFEKLSKDSALLQNEIEFTNFYTEKAVEATGQLYKVKEDMQGGNKIHPVYKSQLETIEIIIAAKKESLDSLNQLINGNPSIDYSTDRNVFMASFELILQTQQNLISQNALLNNQKLDDAQIKNVAVIPVELPEINTKFINEMAILFDKYGYEILQPYFNQILSIANQCPIAGGPAVYQARALIAFFDESILYDDDFVCLQLGLYRQQNPILISKQITNFEISIRPNPAKDKIEIFTSEIKEGVCVIEITDMLGNIVLVSNINCKSTYNSVDVSNLKMGVYSIRLFNTDILNKNQKLLIIK